MNRVYKFTALLIQNFRLEHEPWGRLRTQPSTRISLASTAMQEKFADITLADSSMEGVLFAHEKIYLYDCCTKCFKKVDLTNAQCEHCNTQLQSDHNLRSFNVVLLLANSDLDDVVRVQAFASQLGMDRGSWEEQTVQKRLEDLHMQQMTVQYDKVNMVGLQVKAEAIIFPKEDNQDSGI